METSTLQPQAPALGSHNRQHLVTASARTRLLSGLCQAPSLRHHRRHSMGSTFKPYGYNHLGTTCANTRWLASLFQAPSLGSHKRHNIVTVFAPDGSNKVVTLKHVCPMVARIMHMVPDACHVLWSWPAGAMMALFLPRGVESALFRGSCVSSCGAQRASIQSRRRPWVCSTKHSRRSGESHRRTLAVSLGLSGAALGKNKRNATD